MKHRFMFASIIRPLFFLYITTILLPAVYAIAPSSPKDSALSTLEDYLKTEGRDITLAETLAEVPAIPTFIDWSAPWEKLIIAGGIEHNFSGHKLSIKLGFLRGSFDSYSQTYRAVPGIILCDITADAVHPFILAGAGKNYQSGTLNVWIEFNGNFLEIKNNNNPSESVSFSYFDLLANWEAFAFSYCSDFLGERHCIVPQRIWNGYYNQYGFVATKGSPLYHTTNLPQDFIELFKQEAQNISFKSIAYSLPLRAAFVPSPNQKYVWQVRPMTASEIGETMVNRSAMSHDLLEQNNTFPTSAR